MENVRPTTSSRPAGIATKTPGPKTVAVFGGSFNPPGRHHLSVAETLAANFDEVIIVPCGPRPDKPTVNGIDPIHRAAMADLTFRHLPNVRVEHFDLELSSFTRNHDLERLFSRHGQVWHVVGTDIVRGGATGQSQIQQTWQQGPRIWQDLNYAVFVRPEHELAAGDLPPKHRLFESSVTGSSSEIRERVWRGQDYRELVMPTVADYIDRYRLYQGAPPVAHSRISLDEPRPLVVFDERNSEAVRLAEPFLKIGDEDRPNCVVVVGGDGTMMQALRQHWQLRLPFYGINAGHRGYLLNDRSVAADIGFLSRPAKVRLLPLLYAEAVTDDGQHHGLHAVNDAWVERASGQAAWLEVRVDGQVRLPRLVADGILLSTAHGSNAYARAMGARPLSVDARELLLVGSNVSEPVDWKSAPLPLESVVEVRPLDSVKRPIRGFIDGVDIGRVTGFKVRISHIAAVQLVLTEERDLAVKLHEHFFPSDG